MGKEYYRVRELLRGELSRCRDRDVRVKVELLLLGLKLGNVSEACRRRGFSRKLYYKWMKRLKECGYHLWGLKERSRRPKKSPNKIAWETEEQIRKLNRTGEGARMIEARFKRDGVHRVSRSTICHVLNERKRPKKSRKKHLKAHRRRYELPIPGQRIQIDVKYVPELVEGKRAYNYVAIDECTRWRFAWAYAELNEHMTENFLGRLKEAFPFPINTIQTDNGPEFTWRLIPGEHREHGMDAWSRDNGIRHRCIPPGEKEINGKVERSHRIDSQYFYWRAPTTKLTEFNQSQEQWLKVYNTERLHGGIGYSTPLEKLMERLRTLSKERLESALEPIRLRFLQYTPMKVRKHGIAVIDFALTKEGRLLEKVERELKKLRYAA